MDTTRPIRTLHAIKLVNYDSGLLYLSMFGVLIDMIVICAYPDTKILKSVFEVFYQTPKWG